MPACSDTDKQRTTQKYKGTLKAQPYLAPNHGFRDPLVSVEPRVYSILHPATSRINYAETRDRTGDLQIFSLTLSQLSYRG